MHPIHTNFSMFVIVALYYSTLYIERIAHLSLQTGHCCDSIGHIRYAYLYIEKLCDQHANNE